MGLDDDDDDEPMDGLGDFAGREIAFLDFGQQ